MEEKNEIVKVETVDTMTALSTLNKAEIDMQIATAKQYPRDIEQAVKNIEAMATIDPSTADECFYSVPRANETIEGISVRFAEIVASCWGNLRVQTRILGHDGRHIVAQGICHDLQSNVAVSIEVKRRITDKKGRTFTDDMITVTSMAASAIAYRNAVMKVVPKAVISKICEKVKAVALNSISDEDMPYIIERMMKYFEDNNVSKKDVLKFLGHKKESEITKSDIYMLRTISTAIKEGTATAQEIFYQNVVGEDKSNALIAESQETLNIVEQAMEGGK